MIKTAIIGVSGFGNVHYNDLILYQGRGLLEISAATIINQDEESEKCAKLRSLGCKIYTDYIQMLKDFRGEIDICFIPTGIPLHKPMTIAAMESGANVYVEKPLAATIQEVNDMKKVQISTGKFAAVGYQTMYTPELMLIKETVCSGKLGKIKSIKCCALWPRAEAYYNRNNWAGKLKLKGDVWVLDSPFNNALAHQLNQICFFAGKEIAKSAEIKSIQAELYRGNRIESTDTACMRISTAENIPLYFILTHACETAFGPELVITGEKGEIRWNMTKTVITISGKTEETVCQNGPQMRECIMNKLISRVSDGKTFICDLDIAGTQTLCVNGAHESSEIHQIDSSLLYSIAVKDGYTKVESTQHVIRGIDAVVFEAFEKEKLFSELGVPWAVKGKIISLENYSHFPMQR
ncbi:MAG: Gfo/Idh/MocA family oxidoreductase [Victivallales bacterium]|jgi:predicted dehydrogenase